MLLLIHATATLMMTGLIWFVQIVHYPLLASIQNSEDFAAYHARHTARTTLIVGPLMLVEMICACWLIVLSDTLSAPWMAWAGLALVIINWTSTALIQVPLHHRLSQAFDQTIVRRLVHTNWIRTVAWSARSGLACSLLLAEPWGASA